MGVVLACVYLCSACSVCGGQDGIRSPWNWRYKEGCELPCAGIKPRAGRASSTLSKPSLQVLPSFSHISPSFPSFHQNPKNPCSGTLGYFHFLKAFLKPSTPVPITYTCLLTVCLVLNRNSKGKTFYPPVGNLPTLLFTPFQTSKEKNIKKTL